MRKPNQCLTGLITKHCLFIPQFDTERSKRMLSQNFRATTLRMALSAVVLCLGVFIGVQLTDLAWAEGESINMTAEPPNSIMPSQSSATLREHTCTAFDIFEWNDGQPAVMFGCAPGDGAIAFFTQPASDSKKAARILSLLLTAKAIGKPVIVFYDSAQTNVVGCSPENCRNIQALRLP